MTFFIVGNLKRFGDTFGNLIDAVLGKVCENVRWEFLTSENRGLGRLKSSQSFMSNVLLVNCSFEKCLKLMKCVII